MDQTRSECPHQDRLSGSHWTGAPDWRSRLVVTLEVSVQCPVFYSVSCAAAAAAVAAAVAFRSGGGGGRQVVATDVGVVVGGKRGGG